MKAHTLLHVNIQKRNKRELWERRCKKYIYIYIYEYCNFLLWSSKNTAKHFAHSASDTTVSHNNW